MKRHATKNPLDAFMNGAIFKKDAVERIAKEPALAKMFQNVPVPMPAYVVTDGVHAVTVERTPGGFLTCPNMPDGFNGLAYWDYYADIIEFVCEYNDDIAVEGAYIMDTRGNVLEDQDD